MTLHAASDSDEAFLIDVFVATRREEFSRTGWEPSRIDAFLREQAHLQHTYYRKHYPHGLFDVVALDGAPIGRLYHAWRPEQLGDEVRVIDIALLPEWRGAKIGTRLMHAIVAEAAAQHLPVSLSVEPNNPVVNLYRRLGFIRTAAGEIYDTMRREISPFDLPADSLAGMRRKMAGETSRAEEKIVS